MDVIVKNNIEYVLTNNNKFKTSRVSIKFVMDINNRYATKISVLNTLMKMSNADFSTIKELNDKLDLLFDFKVGGSFWQKGLLSIFELSFNFVASDFLPYNIVEEACKLVKSVCLKPNFDNEDYLEIAKNKHIIDSKSLYDDKFRYSLKKAKDMIEEDVLLNQNPSVEELERLTMSDMKEAYEHIMDSSKVYVFIDGVESESIYDKLCDVQLNSKESLNQYLNCFNTEKSFKFKAEKQQINQAKFVSIAKLNSTIENKFAYDLFNMILGGYSSSRLFLNIREEKGLAYSIRSIYDFALNYMIILGGISNPTFDNDYETVEEINREIQSEINAIIEGISEEELQMAQSMIINSLNSTLDSQFETQTVYFMAMLRGETFDVEKYRSSILNVTVEDVQNVAKEIHIHYQFVLRGETDEQ